MNKVLICPECFSDNIGVTEDDGYIDCFNCSIWFDPNHSNNIACFMTREQAQQAKAEGKLPDEALVWQTIEEDL